MTVSPAFAIADYSRMTPMTAFLVLAAIGAAAAIACEERASGRHPAFFFLKPLTTLLVLGAAATAPDAAPAYRTLVLAALVASTAGDIALLFEGDGAFVAGLSSFLVAHALFVFAFAGGTGWGWPAPVAAVPAIAGLAFFARLLPRTGVLMPAVAIYGTALLAMMLTASGRDVLRGGDASGVLAFVGSVLFLLSDAALAVRRFFAPYRHAQAVILVTYWLAIGLVAGSVAHSALALTPPTPAP